MHKMVKKLPDILDTDYLLLPRSAKDAIVKDQKFYFSSKVCSRGHTASRYVKGGCVLCIHLRAQISDKKSKEKSKKINAEMRVATVKICSHKQCSVEFSPKNRTDQIYCSTRCADISGKQFYKIRNSEQIKISENKRKKKKFDQDLECRGKQVKRSNTGYHSLTSSEKKERQKKVAEKRNLDSHRAHMRPAAKSKEQRRSTLSDSQ